MVVEWSGFCNYYLFFNVLETLIMTFQFGDPIFHVNHEMNGKFSLLFQLFRI